MPWLFVNFFAYFSKLQIGFFSEDLFYFLINFDWFFLGVVGKKEGRSQSR